MGKLKEYKAVIQHHHKLYILIFEPVIPEESLDPQNDIMARDCLELY